MKNTKELYLVIQKKYFLEILKGIKKEEYRDFTDYNIERLCELDESGNISGIIEYETVKFQAGYVKNAPQLIVKFNGVTIERDEEMGPDDELTTENCNFVIELGEILKKINCEKL